MRRTSRTVSVDVDVDIEEFPTKDLIEELHGRKILSETESKKLLARKESVDEKADGLDKNFDMELLDEARWRAGRGELSESLILLARAYPGLQPLLRLV